MTKLKELVKYIQPSNYLVKSTNYSDEYDTPVLTPNKSFLLGYTNEKNTFNRDCIIIDDFTLDVKYVDFPFMLKSSASKILVSDQMDLYYLFYLLKTYPFVLNGHGRHYISYVQEIEFDFPSLEEQQKIGSFFKELDELIELHQQHVILHTNKFRWLLNEMFSKEDKVPIKNLCEGAFSGSTPKSTNKEYYENGTVPFFSISDIEGKYLYHTVKSITSLAVQECKMKIASEETLICTMYASPGIPFITKIPVALPQSVLALLPKSEYNIDYLYYSLLYSSKQLQRMSGTGTQANLSKQTIMDFSIPIDASSQEKVVKILNSACELIEMELRLAENLYKAKKYYLNKIFN